MFVVDAAYITVTMMEWIKDYYVRIFFFLIKELVGS